MLRSELLPIYKREIKAYFQSPATYVAMGLFLAFIALFHTTILKAFIEASTRQMEQQQGPLNLMDQVVTPLFGILNVMMIFVVPILTMRLFSEEKRLGSFELLVTCPLRDWSILLGKYFAGLTIGWLALAMNLIFLVVLRYLAPEGALEYPVIAAGLLGSALVIASFIAFGVFASSVTENQMLSAMMTLIGLFLLWLLGALNLAVGKEYFGVKIDEMLKSISIFPHLDPFIRGQINLTDTCFFLVFIVFFLVLTSKILEARRWRV